MIVGMIASAALLLMNGANFGTEEPDVVISILICVAAFVAVYFVKIHPILIIIAAGVVGFLVF